MNLNKIDKIIWKVEKLENWHNWKKCKIYFRISLIMRMNISLSIENIIFMNIKIMEPALRNKVREYFILPLDCS